MHPALTSKAARLALLVVIIPWLAMATWLCGAMSVTSDEIPGLMGGLATLLYGDHRMNPEHPPLTKLVAALPVYLLDKPAGTELPIPAALAPFWEQSDPTTIAFEMFGRGPSTFQAMIFHARLPMVLFGLAGIVMAFVMARRLEGDTRAGVFAALLLAYYPEYLGHSIFVTTDVPQLAACGAVSWSVLHWWRRPSWQSALVFGAVAGVASLVKLPCSFFVAVCGVTMVVLAAKQRFRRVTLRALALLGILTVLCCWGAQWAGSGFRFTATGPGMPSIMKHRYIPPLDPPPGPASRVANALHRWHFLPENSLATITHLDFFKRRSGYYLGNAGDRGWYTYFLTTYFLKTPLPLIGLTGVVLVMGARSIRARMAGGRARDRWRFQQRVLFAVPWLVMLASTVLQRVNIGHRHILFIYFPLAVLGGMVLARIAARGSLASRGVFLFCALYLASIAATVPWYSTYFNVIGGDPYRASRWVGDSNTDWGQQLRWAADESRRLGYTSYYYAPYSNYPPELYAVSEGQYLPIDGPGFRPPLSKRSYKPDGRLPTFVSVNRLAEIRRRWPWLYARAPDRVVNSMAVYLPQ